MNSLDDSINIIGINLNRPHRDGSRIIAHFDVELFGIEIRGCALIRTVKDGVAISTPHLSNQSAQRGVWFTDVRLNNGVLRAAREAYRRMGGIDLPDWAKKPEAD
jgi:hypothetical protein